MTLRDYFAAHAPHDLISDAIDHRETAKHLIGRTFPEGRNPVEQMQWSVAVEAAVRYAYADAMLVMRGK